LIEGHPVGSCLLAQALSYNLHCIFRPTIICKSYRRYRDPCMTSALLLNLTTTARLVSLFWPITPLGILLMLLDPLCLAGLRPVGRCAGGYNTIVRTVGKLFRGQGQSVSASVCVLFFHRSAAAADDAAAQSRHQSHVMLPHSASPSTPSTLLFLAVQSY
jgi:hypothetical protein